MKTVDADVQFAGRASRLELLVRIFWTIIASIVLIVFAIIGTIALFLQWFYILFLGRRHKTLHVLIKTYVLQQFRIRSYASLLTDERPPIIPEMEQS